MTGCSHLLDNGLRGLGEPLGSRMRGARQCASPAGRNTLKTKEIVCANRAEKTGLLGQVVRMTLGICLTAFLASSALAQYGGGGTGMGTGTPGTPGYVPPKSGYGSGKAIGIGIGAAAGAGALFLVLHHHGGVTGCVRQTDDGLRLVDEKKNKSYTLEAGSVNVKPGDRVELKGKKSSGNGGAEMFEPMKVVKNLGSCSAEAAH